MSRAVLAASLFLGCCALLGSRSRGELHDSSSAPRPECAGELDEYSRVESGPARFLLSARRACLPRLGRPLELSGVNLDLGHGLEVQASWALLSEEQGRLLLGPIARTRGAGCAGGAPALTLELGTSLLKTPAGEVIDLRQEESIRSCVSRG